DQVIDQLTEHEGLHRLD
ncbi:MAG: hypothetical protein EZS28_018988, partial [Streblomastix strix]